MPWTVVEFHKGLDRSGFNCGSARLNDYLRRYISQDLKRGLAKAYAAVESGTSKVLGFYTLSSAQVGCHEVPERWRKKAGVYPVPCSLIGRLAVDKRMQGRGLGEELLMHAYHTVERAARHIGIKALIVAAEDEVADRFYRKYGFEHLQEPSRAAGRTMLFLELGGAGAAGMRRGGA